MTSSAQPEPLAKRARYEPSLTIEAILNRPFKELTLLSLEDLKRALSSDFDEETALELSKAFYNRAISEENLRSASWPLQCYHTVDKVIQQKKFRFMPHEQDALRNRREYLKAKYRDDQDRHIESLRSKLQDATDIHHVITSYMPVKDAGIYFAAMRLPNGTCVDIEVKKATPEQIFRTFEDYCTTHPSSFLALVCRPALQRALPHTPMQERAAMLNQILSEYLDKTIPQEASFYEIKILFENFEVYYQSKLRWFYSLFFTHLLSCTTIRPDQQEVPLYMALGEPESLSENPTSMTVEEIAHIIEKCHMPQYRHALEHVQTISITKEEVASDPLFAQIPPERDLLFVSKPTCHVPPELKLLSGLRSLEITHRNFTTIDIRQHPLLESLNLCHNRLDALNLNHTPLLRVINVSNNRLTSLDLSQQTELRRLKICSNFMTELDLAHNPQLTVLDGRDNLFKSIDLTHNTILTTEHTYLDETVDATRQ